MTNLDARNLTKTALSEAFDAGEQQAIFRELANWIVGEDCTALWAPHHQEQLHQALLRLQQGEPLQYITGQAWFYDMPFRVNRHVLIPRPETEELVHLVAKALGQQAHPWRIADLGTGSGCIPITLKKLLPAANITGADISREALEVAKTNALLLKQQVQWIAADLLDFKSLDTLAPLDVLVSNPPYITPSEADLLSVQVREYEPHTALFVTNQDPLQFYKAIAQLGKRLLTAGGRIYLECHRDHAQDVCRLLQTAGYEATMKEDMSGNPRFVFARLMP